MDAERAGERAHAKAIELLDKLKLSEAEQEAVRTLYMRMLKTLNDSREVWKLIEGECVRLVVIPSAAAMLTAYTDELMTAMGGSDESPGGAG